MRAKGLLIAGALMSLAWAPSAHAFIYWADFPKGTIGRANNDGSGVNDSFITRGNGPYMVTVNADHIYWANQSGNSIGRANIDGSGVDQNFISGLAGPTGVAVTSTYVFWSTVTDQKIGRANLDATGVNQSFISTGGGEICGVAIDSPAPAPAPPSGAPSNAFSFGKLTLHRRAGTATLPVTIADPGTLA